MFRRKADLDFLAFCVLKETTRTTADDLDEDGAERPRLPRAVMDRRSRPGPEPTTGVPVEGVEEFIYPGSKQSSNGATANWMFYAGLDLPVQ